MQIVIIHAFFQDLTWLHVEIQFVTNKCYLFTLVNNVVVTMYDCIWNINLVLFDFCNYFEYNSQNRIICRSLLHGISWI